MTGKIARIDAPALADMTDHDLEAEGHLRTGLTRYRAKHRQSELKANTARLNEINAEIERRWRNNERHGAWNEPQFPEGMPDFQLSARLGHPANLLRDLFFTNKGRIAKRVMDNAVGRLAVNYGWAIHETWAGLVYEEYAVHDGDEWVWPMALPDYQFGPETTAVNS